MDNTAYFSPECVTASYTPQRVLAYRGNRMIEALPPPLDEGQLAQALTLAPDFNTEQRNWPTHERRHLLKGLANWMYPLERHIELCHAIDSMMRSGYVGREPRTAAHTAAFQRIYELQKSGKAFSQTASTVTPQCSTALIGTPGMGKTMATKRFLATYPRVIYHPDLNFYQIPYLFVETPSDGKSAKGLGTAILNEIDKLIPGAGYYERYASRGNPGADTLMRNVARVMQMHLVGLFVGDEIQNLANSRKGKQTVMTEIVSANNDLRTPSLFLGTNKARSVLSLDFRQARRSCGDGIASWEPLAGPGKVGEYCEWTDFIIVLWRLQWVRKPVVFSAHFGAVMHDLSQGIIDVAIKLFFAAQVHAMLNGSETITVELLHEVYERYLSPLHPMLKALRKRDYEALMRFDDIAPLSFSDLSHKFDAAFEGARVRAASIGTDHASFSPRLTAALVATGVDEGIAKCVADDTKEKGEATNTLDGLRTALAEMRRPSRPKKVVDPEDQLMREYPERPLDYRNALAIATANGTKVLDALKLSGAAPDLREVLGLN